MKPRPASNPSANLMTRTHGLDGGGSIAADGSGNVYVLWHGQPRNSTGEGNRRVWIARSSDDGATFSSEEPASLQPTGACGCCGTTALADGQGSVYLLYRAATNSVERDMVLLTSRDRGLRFDEARLDPWRINACPMSTGSLVVDGESGILVAWETKGQVAFARVDRRPASVLRRPRPAARTAPGSTRAWRPTRRARPPGLDRGDRLAERGLARLASLRPIGSPARPERSAGGRCASLGSSAAIAAAGRAGSRSSVRMVIRRPAAQVAWPGARHRGWGELTGLTFRLAGLALEFSAPGVVPRVAKGPDPGGRLVAKQVIQAPAVAIEAVHRRPEPLRAARRARRLATEPRPWPGAEAGADQDRRGGQAVEERLLASARRDREEHQGLLGPLDRLLGCARGVDDQFQVRGEFSSKNAHGSREGRFRVGLPGPSRDLVVADLHESERQSRRRGEPRA